MEANPVPLKPGMVISDEPAMYRTGEYGIRTENMVLVREDSETEYGKFYGFDTLTLCYIDTKLIVVPMLSVREHAWINKYHQMVYDLLSPHLNEDEKAWLKESLITMPGFSGTGFASIRILCGPSCTFRQ